MSPTPEQRARQDIDAALEAAGWVVPDRAGMNLAGGLGVAVREFKMTSGHGFADDLLFMNGKAVGVLEAKPAGYALTNVELQADKYATGLPPAIAAVATYPARFTGRLAEAEAGLQAARRIFPDDDEIGGALGLTHALQGRHAEAQAELDSSHASPGLRAWALGHAGRRDSARAILRRLEELRREAVSPWQLALASVGAGERERALDYLEAAERGRVRQMAWLRVFPYFTPLRNEPRYQALLTRMRFPP